MSRAHGKEIMSLLGSAEVEVTDGFDFRTLFRNIELYRTWMPDDDDDASEEDEDEEDDDEENDDTSGEDGSKDKKKEEVKDPDKQRLSAEAKKHRLAKKAAEKERDDAKAALAKLQDKDKDGNEKLESENKELTEWKAKHEPIVREQALKIGYYESGVAAQFDDPEIAYTILQSRLKDVDLEDDGTVDASEIKDIAEALLKEKPKLAASGGKDDKEEGKDDDESNASGRAMNGKKKKGKLDQTNLMDKFPALRR